MYVGDFERFIELARRAVQTPPAKQPAVTLPPQMRGSLAGEFIPDQVNEILAELSEEINDHLVCVWDRVDRYGFGGGYRLRFATGGPLLTPAEDLVGWLTTDPADPACPETPGDPDYWVGYEDYADPIPCFDDDEHNYAFVDDRDAEQTLEVEERLLELGMPQTERTVCEHCGEWLTGYHVHDELGEDNTLIRLPWRTDFGGPGGPFALAYAPNPQASLQDRHIGSGRFPDREAAQAAATAANNASALATTAAEIPAIADFAVVINIRDHIHRKPEN
ncbi:hypothetical protein AB0C34_17375 [Nocardia sp. NPDC049220]|uniref:hypothetical protein n=1 Tax=Nocardia sp. NPDC049220 TaxID=3155273 RepID=UPI0033C4A010